MNADEFVKRQHRARRQSIWYKGKLLLPRSGKRTICNVHLELVQEIIALKLPEDIEKKLLVLIDEVYNMGKRMDNALDYYAELTGKDKKDAAVS